MAQQTVEDVMRRYLSDAIAAEKSFETQLRTFAKDTDQGPAQMVFTQHADETKRQHERLTERLEALGGSTSTVKSFLAHLFSIAPKAAQFGHDEAEKGTQDLIAAYAVENSEIAMYEALAVSAAACGDSETERLARAIQEEERQARDKVWNLIAPSAQDSFGKVTGGAMARAA